MLAPSLHVPGITVSSGAAEAGARGDAISAGPVTAGPVSAPPGRAGVWVRSNDPTDVTIQTAATKTVIPTTPAVMR
jgi:hypothetical protein